MNFFTGFLRFWYDFIVGDAWEIAAGVLLVLAVGATLLRTHRIAPEFVSLLVTAGICAVVGASLLIEVRRRLKAPASAPVKQ